MSKKNPSTRRGVATPKQTAGGGFAFEDKVVAYYLVRMLTGNPLLIGDLHNKVSRIDCQVRVDGWFLDDLLITIVQKEEKHRCAFSIKSNVQFSSSKAGSTFVADLWASYLHEGSEVFNTSLDRLGLICTPQPNPPISALYSLLKKAREQTSDQLFSRIQNNDYASVIERNLFLSFACPQPLASKYGIDEKSIGDLLKRLAIIEFNLEREESSDEDNALSSCRGLLIDPSIKNSEALWNNICKIAQKIRTAGGGSTREDLLIELRDLFEFRELPDFSGDWHRLQSWCESQMNVIQESIGGKVRVDRSELAKEILDNLVKSNSLVLIAPSGTGKSVVGKWVAKEFSRHGKVLWFDASELRPNYIEYFASQHGLTHPLSDVLQSRNTSRGLIVIDGIERLRNEEDFNEACSLLYTLGFDKPECTWKLLISCRTEEWERVQTGLFRFFGNARNWNIKPIPKLSYQDLEPVWQAFGALQTIAIRPHLREFILNPKILDILAIVLSSGSEIEDRDWIGESDIIKWYWKKIIRGTEQGIARSSLLQRIAEMEANSGIFEFPESELSSSESNLVNDLKGILSVREDRATISFSHDLFADWARFIAIQSHDTEFKVYIKDKYKNPHWQKALRLYGLSLLEEDKTAKKWESRLHECPEIQSFLLEALVFGGNPTQLLSNAWPILLADDGKLLKDFLMRFQYFATYPNPQYVQIAKEVGATDAEARTWERLPLWIYWLGTLAFLESHYQEASQLAPIEIGKVAYLWLRYTPNDWPARSQAAQLALATAQVIFSEHYHERNYTRSELQYPYKAALEAYLEKPEEVRQFALKACSRIEPTEKDGEAFSRFRSFTTFDNNGFSNFIEKSVPDKPWPDGPLYRQDELFKKVCLDTDALRSVMRADPKLAQEIILALLIEVRTQRSNVMSAFDRKSTGLDEETESWFYPGFYTRGPFIFFLKTNPTEALEMIIRLINFATEQHIKAQYDGNDKQIGVNLPVPSDNKFYLGNANVFYWCRPFPNSTKIILSALTAVEKWLYDCIDQKESIDQWISLTLDRGKSIALIGMLSQVGRYSPILFLGVLKSLLLSPELYRYDILYNSLGSNVFGTPFSMRDGEWFFNLTRKWDSMPHRNTRLIDIAIYYFHNSTDFKESLIKRVEEWKKLVEEKRDPSYTSHIEQLIALFDPKNWITIKSSDETEQLVFKPPKNLQVSAEEQEQIAERQLLLTRPLECRNRIDKSNPLTTGEITEYLAQAKVVAGSISPGEDIKRAQAIDNLVFGTIAVLFIFHRQWLYENPQEEEWCREYVKNKLKQTNVWSSIDKEGSLLRDTWVYFACEIIPILWAENPQSKEYRRIVAEIAIKTYRNSIEILIRRSFEKRLALGKSFWELVNLVWDLARINYHMRSPSGRRQNIFLSWRNKLWRIITFLKFASGVYSTKPPKLSKSSIGTRLTWNGNVFDSHVYEDRKTRLFCLQPKIDIEQIKEIFSNIFLPDQTEIATERSVFFDLWSEILEISLMRLRILDKDGRGVNAEKVECGLPYDFDYWMLDRIGTVISQLNPEEHPEQIWLPLLQLGPRAHHWIERFLTNWFLAVKPIANHEKFVLHWRQMLDYCLSSDIWTKREAIKSYELPSMWLNLIGISNVGDLWNKEDLEIIVSMREYFVKVAPHALQTGHDIERLISWVCKPSSTPIRLEMLLPLANAFADRCDGYSEERRLTTTLASYLVILWEEHHQEIKREPENGKAFEKLLHIGVDMHEPLALELQTRVATAPR